MVLVIRPPVRRSRALSIGLGIAKSIMFLLPAVLGATLVTVTTVLTWRWLGIGAGRWMTVVVVLIGLILMGIDLHWVRLQLPGRQHQVSREIIMRYPWGGIIPYGFALGTGFWTYLHATLPYFGLLALAVIGDPRSASFAAIGFAAGRTLPVAGSMFVGDIKLEALDQWIETQIEPASRSLSAGVIFGIATWMLIGQF